jgi:hypothetical protein
MPEEVRQQQKIRLALALALALAIARGESITAWARQNEVSRHIPGGHSENGAIASSLKERTQPSRFL